MQKIKEELKLCDVLDKDKSDGIKNTIIHQNVIFISSLALC